jgi:hypothetical protein
MSLTVSTFIFHCAWWYVTQFKNGIGINVNRDSIQICQAPKYDSLPVRWEIGGAYQKSC